MKKISVVIFLLLTIVIPSHLLAGEEVGGKTIITFDQDLWRSFTDKNGDADFEVKVKQPDGTTEGSSVGYSGNSDRWLSMHLMQVIRNQERLEKKLDQILYKQDEKKKAKTETKDTKKEKYDPSNNIYTPGDL